MVTPNLTCTVHTGTITSWLHLSSPMGNLKPLLHPSAPRACRGLAHDHALVQIGRQYCQKAHSVRTSDEDLRGGPVLHPPPSTRAGTRWEAPWLLKRYVQPSPCNGVALATGQHMTPKTRYAVAPKRRSVNSTDITTEDAACRAIWRLGKQNTRAPWTNGSL